MFMFYVHWIVADTYQGKLPEKSCFVHIVLNHAYVTVMFLSSLLQVRTGVANKAVLSYSALLQAGTGSGSGGGGGSVTGKKEGQSSPHSPQPLLLQAASPATVKGAAALAKTGGATISIITGKVLFKN